MSAEREAMRYMGVTESEEIYDKTVKTLALVREESPPRFIYRICPIDRAGENFALRGTDIVLSGKSANRMLSECDMAAVMICTLGFGFEKLMRTFQVRSISDAVILDACGSALVEEGCDETEKEIAALMPGKHLSDRFSPGYGDIPLDVQTDILSALNASKQLGVHLSDSMLLSPQKTVTAFIGLADKSQPARIRGCNYCSLSNVCSIRKRGGSCGK